MALRTRTVITGTATILIRIKNHRCRSLTASKNLLRPTAAPKSIIDKKTVGAPIYSTVFTTGSGNLRSNQNMTSARIDIRTPGLNTFLRFIFSFPEESAITPCV